MTTANLPCPMMLKERVALLARPNLCQRTLMMLIENGEHKTIERLIQKNEAGCERGDGDHEVLCLSAERRWGSICNALIKAGADVDARDEKGQTALMVVSQAANSRAMKILVDCGADVNTHDDLGWTPLLAACLTSWDAGRLKAMKTLFDAGAKLEAENHEGATALIILAERNDERALDWVRKMMAQYQRNEFDVELTQAPSKARPIRSRSRCRAKARNCVEKVW